MAEKGRRRQDGYVPMAQVDAMVRSRLAEMMAAAGVEQSRQSAEVLYGLPRQFTQAYEVLYDLATRGVQGPDTRSRVEEVGRVDDPGLGGKATGGGSGGRVRDTEATRERYAEVVVRSGGSARRAARGGAKGSSSGLRLGEDAALELKTRIDKRLRGLSRDIVDELRELGLGFDETTGEGMVQIARPGGGTGGRELGTVGRELGGRSQHRVGGETEEVWDGVDDPIIAVTLADGTISHRRRVDFTKIADSNSNSKHYGSEDADGI